MRIAFISANRETMPDAVIPLGLLYVMQATPDEHEKLFWDLCFDAEPVGRVIQSLEDYRPDVVAIGLRNLQNMDYTNSSVNLDWYRTLIQAIRGSSAAPIILGGGGFTVAPKALMTELGVDFGIAGEGERSFPALLDELKKPSPDLERVERLYYRRNGQILFTGDRASYLDITAIPQPSRADVSSRYYADYGIESLQTKRGCSLRCDYCTYPLIEGREIRMRDPGAVAADFMALCQRPGLAHVFVVDSVFNLPIRHAKQVCRELINRNNRTPWTSYISPVAFDDELAALMVAAGAGGAEIGSDSGSDAVLNRLKKGFQTDKIRRLASISRAHGLKDCHSFILGTKGETLDDVQRTLDFVEDLSPFAAIMLVWVDDGEVLDRETALQRRKFRDQIYGLLRERAAHQPRWVVPFLGIRFGRRLFDVIRRQGTRGPLWQHLDSFSA
jgi:radical SAM superfamily enzyme YgiQ (UPF0313 family)